MPAFDSQRALDVGVSGFPSSGGALELIENFDFGGDATSHSFAGLDGDTEEVYLLVYKIIKAVAAATNVDLKPNGTATNQEMRAAYYGSGGTGNLNATALRISSNGAAAVGWIDAGQAWIDAKTGTKRTVRANYLQSDPAAGTNIYEIDAACVWNENATNITSIDVVCDQANGIKAGSYLRLYKLKKA